MFEKIGGRKFLALVIALSVVVVFFALGKIAEANMIDSLKWIVGIYVAGNVGDSIAAVFTKPSA